METLATNGCRLCGGDVGKTFKVHGFTWFACSRCRGIQKELTHAEYQALNPTYDPGAYLDCKDRSEIEAYLEIPTKVAFLSQFIDLYLGGRREKLAFLDVGCGMGGYLLAAQVLGFDAIGFEPSSDHAHVATDLLHLRVINDYFSPDLVGDQRFDVIMLSHVIEHIYRPVEVVRALVGKLKRGGILIIVTPNSDSLIAAVTGRNWVMLKPVDHVSMISSLAYEHFEIATPVSIHHHWSEYPFEFAATIVASVRMLLQTDPSEKRSEGARPSQKLPPPLRRAGYKTRLLKVGLSVCSIPFHVAAVWSRRQACLTTVLVRGD